MRYHIQRVILVVMAVFCFTLAINVAQPLHAQSGCPQPRLTIGESGRITPGSPNRVRDVATTSGALLGEIPGGAAFEVLEGPICAEGFLWWRVDYNGLVGWTAEGNSSGYFVEPVEEAGSAATATPAAPAATSAVCDMETRLEVGRQGKTTSSTPSRLRNQAGTNGSQVGQVGPLDTFNILEGPVCVDGIQWWRVDNGGVVGWTAEAVDGEYLLEMLDIVPTATPAYIGFMSPEDVAWSGDGSKIAVGTLDGLYVFDATDFSAEPEHFLEKIHVSEVVFNPQDANIVAVMSRRFVGDEVLNSAYLFDLEREESILTLSLERPINPPNSLHFVKGGEVIAINAGGNPTLIDAETGERLYSIQMPDWSNGSVAFLGAKQITVSPDASYLGVNDGYIHVVPEGGSVAQITTLERDIEAFIWVLTMAFSPDSKNLIIGDEDGNLQMWDVETGERTSFMRGQQRSSTSNKVYELAFHPDGSVVVSAEGDPHAVVRVFHAETLQLINAYTAEGDSKMVSDLAFNPDGTQLAILLDDSVVILETETYTPLAELFVKHN